VLWNRHKSSSQGRRCLELSPGKRIKFQTSWYCSDLRMPFAARQPYAVPDAGLPSEGVQKVAGTSLLAKHSLTTRNTWIVVELHRSRVWLCVLTEVMDP
jgi:hypothetical protein